MKSASQRLADIVASGKATPDLLKRVKIYPKTWSRWINQADINGLDWFDASQDEVTVERQDLVGLASAIIADESTVTLRRLFVATMMWGSGPWNGRGPRNTSLALADGRLNRTLKETHNLVINGQPGEAYARFMANRVGPSFFTKWLWATGLGSDLEVVPLVLDQRVWASLGALGWDSRAAANGSRLRKDRYRAYLYTCAQWAADAPTTFSGPEDVENVLFQWAGEQPGMRRGGART